MAACAGRIYETFVSQDAALDYVEMVRAFWVRRYIPDTVPCCPAPKSVFYSDKILFYVPLRIGMFYTVFSQTQLSVFILFPLLQSLPLYLFVYLFISSLFLSPFGLPCPFLFAQTAVPLPRKQSSTTSLPSLNPTCNVFRLSCCYCFAASCHTRSTDDTEYPPHGGRPRLPSSTRPPRSCRTWPAPRAVGRGCARAARWMQPTQQRA